MVKKFILISFAVMAFGVVLAGPFVAEGRVVQGLLVGTKLESAGGFTNADLNGTYWFRSLSFENTETNDPSSNITFGSVTFDGNGLWTGSGTGFDSDGTTESGAFNGTYSVDPDGSYSFVIKGTPPEPDQTLNGQISRDADRQFSVLTEGEISSGDIHQGITMVVKASDSAFSMSDLNGTWRFHDLELRSEPGEPTEASTCKGTLNINNPNWNVDVSCFESDGTTHDDTVSGTYTLNGHTYDFSITGVPQILFSAYLSIDGNTIIFSRGYADEDEIEMFAGAALRKTAKTFNNADLSGSYAFHNIVLEAFETEDRETGINHGSVTFDGIGNWTGSAHYFDSDGSSGSDNISGTYAVQADGSFTLVTAESPPATLTGNISDDANTIIMSEGENVFDGNGEGIGYHVTSELWTKAVLQVPGYPVTLIWQIVGADITPSGDQVISGYFYADPNDFAYGSVYNPEVFVKIYIAQNGWSNIAFNHVTVDDVTVYSAHHYAGTPTQTGLTALTRRLVEHQYTGVTIDTSLQTSSEASGTSVSTGYTLSSDLWAKAILQPATGPVNLIWKEVGSDTTLSGDRVVSGYFYASPDDFAYGSIYNPEVFVKVYIASNGWANMAFNHVTVDGVDISSAHDFSGQADQDGRATLENRLVEHQYDGVSLE